MEFVPFPKVPRLNRMVVVTEKIDGTNAQVHIRPAIDSALEFGLDTQIEVGGIPCYLRVGSRTRWIGPGDDNHGFAQWAYQHAHELAGLGIGAHFGEWWGSGIQRGYGLAKGDKRFSLFNYHRWAEKSVRPACCGVVPLLFSSGEFNTADLKLVMEALKNHGSHAAPGFMDPEGIMVYHTAANSIFKATFDGDGEGKTVAKERAPRQPRDPSKGGRRKGQIPFEGPDRRTAHHPV